MSEASAILHIHTSDDSLHEITADLLCQLVQSLQQMTYLTAAAKAGMGTRRHIFGTSGFTDEYQLVCELPKKGSYVLPFKIRNVVNPSLDQSAAIFSDLMIALAGVEAGDISKTVLVNLSTENRARFASALSKMTAKQEKSWYVSIDMEGALSIEGVPQVFEFSKNLANQAERVLKISEEIPEEVMSVIGELISVNFESNTLSIRHNGTHKEISCSYRPEVVDQILQNKSGSVQVTGKFTLDNDGNPKSLSDVSSIVPVDLSQIIIPSFTVGNSVIHSVANADVAIIPTLDENLKQMFVAENKELGIEVFAVTRDQLIDEIIEQLVVNWLEYAKAEDGGLTSAAKDLKRSLLAHYFEEGV